MTAADPALRRHDRVIAMWLFVVVGMVFAMVVLGGMTRLTHSGLSMVEWKPLTGWLPPLNETEWQAAFGQYRQFPEYAEFNPGSIAVSKRCATALCRRKPALFPRPSGRRSRPGCNRARGS